MCCIPKILKNESNSQQWRNLQRCWRSCVVSQRYSKMKAIHNARWWRWGNCVVVLYPKDTQKWKQFTTVAGRIFSLHCCVVSQRYSKMKAIHNLSSTIKKVLSVVLYPKDTQKWKQFTTAFQLNYFSKLLCCIPKILKNESNSQLINSWSFTNLRCVVSQRYSKMKAIHNSHYYRSISLNVVLYPKDTQKWKQFTTFFSFICIWFSCVVSQRYSKMKAIHNCNLMKTKFFLVVLYPKDTQKWKQFTT